MSRRARRPAHLRWAALALVGAACGVAASAASAADADPTLKVLVDADGIVRLTAEDLEDAGLPIAGRDPRRLALRRGSRLEPIHVHGEEDGRWDPGDTVDFIGRRHLDADGASDRYTDVTAYYLAYGDAPGLRFRTEAVDAVPDRLPRPLAYREHVLLEEDRVHERSSQGPSADDDFWYWARVSSMTRGGRHAVKVVLEGVRGDVDRPDRLRVALDGLSHLPIDPDHHVVVEVNQRPVGEFRWDGQAMLRPEVELPPGLLEEGANWIVLFLPGEHGSGSEEVGLDVVLLNWIELDYWSELRARDGALDFVPPEAWPQRVHVRVAGLRGADVVAYRDDGVRLLPGRIDDEEGLWGWSAPTGAGARHFVTDARGRREPVALELDHPSRLRDTDQGADLIVITHPDFADALTPLVEQRRREGLRVVLARVDDVYDEFNEGIARPEALRRFLEHAWSEWQPPRPRYVLLVGDATWDFKNARSDGISNYVPSYYPPSEKFGTYASDSWFADVEGDDGLPDLAIGRLPVRDAGEAAAVVDKLLAYASEPAGGWARRVIFITSVESYLQRHTHELAQRFLADGYEVVHIHPQEEEELGSLKQRIQEEWSRGGGIVYFVGHGGAYLWEVGPEGWRNEEFLMDHEDFASLAETAQLPFVMSLSCYTNTFDNPTLEASLGETFVRGAGRGAVAVLSSSWRASTSAMMRLGEHVFSDLFERGERVLGDVVLEGIRVSEDDDLVRSFVLLGDPSLRLHVGRHGPPTAH